MGDIWELVIIVYSLWKFIKLYTQFEHFCACIYAILQLKFTFRKKNTIALGILLWSPVNSIRCHHWLTHHSIFPLFPSAQFLNVSLSTVSLTWHSTVFSNYKYSWLMASPILTSENTTEAIKWWLNTSFPPVQREEATWALSSHLLTHHTPIIPPLLHQPPPLFLPDHYNTQICSNIAHLASVTTHLTFLPPQWIILVLRETSNPTYLNLECSCYPSVPSPLVFPTLVYSTMIHTAAQDRNHLIPFFSCLSYLIHQQVSF